MPQYGWTLEDWKQAYLSGRLQPEALVGWVVSFDHADPAFIHIGSAADIAAQCDALARRLVAAGGQQQAFPLYGVPFAVKDNIDVGGWPTTAACPAFKYVADQDAEVVMRLRNAGAIVVAKTNMDQFATGLVGTRSPYGTVRSCFNPDYIGGGSSSGSAAVVGRGLVPFALGTDTAGSGRVPAAFQNVVGFKPTRGTFSTRGVVPACRTLDCVSVFALTVQDAATVAVQLAAYDDADPYSREICASSARRARRQDVARIAVPAELEFFGDQAAEAAFRASVAQLQQLDFEFVPVPFHAFSALAELLYASPWVVERRLAAAAVLEQQPSAVEPVVRHILGAAQGYTAEAAFKAEYQRAALARAVARLLADVDALLVPTTPTVYRVDEVVADPLTTNARLGTYTNFTNLADLCAIAVPGIFRADGLPAGLTLLSPAFHEELLAALATQIQHHLALPLGATGRAFSDLLQIVPGPAPYAVQQRVVVAVFGAHLSGLPLNHQLTDRGGKLEAATQTAARYRLYALPGDPPKKPGIVRIEGGAAIALELWSLPSEQVGGFVAGIPAPLGLGKIELQDGRWVTGFICEPCAIDGSEDITAFGGFRAYLDNARLD